MLCCAVCRQDLRQELGRLSNESTRGPPPRVVLPGRFSSGADVASDSNDETATVVDGGEFHLTSNGKVVNPGEVAEDVDDGAADELIKASGWLVVVLNACAARVISFSHGHRIDSDYSTTVHGQHLPGRADRFLICMIGMICMMCMMCMICMICMMCMICMICMI